ncbi:GNAT family N-acetyltransferase [Propioniciclava soli]|uniref:GNAT family N-acetyltransferase n=1 Tax=Propioniciclava soli TaxID=2775081 RepID=A0ABZ3CA36_9ACTN
MHLVRPLPMDAAALPAGVGVRPLEPADLDAVARLYLASYPAGVAVASLAEAGAEMEAVFAGDFGAPIAAATLVALSAGEVVGCIQTVLDPPWDAPEGPFVIELFVHPDHRRRGIGEGLLAAAASALWQAGHVSVGLNVEPVEAMAAFRIYQRLGFRALG